MLVALYYSDLETEAKETEGHTPIKYSGGQIQLAWLWTR
jgi:hypothetical protein